MENYKNTLNEVVVIESSPETYFVYAIRNAIRISKCAYPTAKKVIFKREDVEVEISEMETESSLYEKFKEKQKNRVWNLMSACRGCPEYLHDEKDGYVWCDPDMSYGRLK